MTSRTAVAALLATLVVTPLAACGSDAPSDAAVAAPEQRQAAAKSRVKITFDKREIGDMSSTFKPTEVDCRRTGTGGAPILVTRADTSFEDFLTVKIRAVDEPTTYRIPTDRAGRKALMSKAFVSYVSESVMASTMMPTTEGGGTIKVLEASCDPLVLRVRIDARIGVNYAERPARVVGKINLRG